MEIKRDKKLNKIRFHCWQIVKDHAWLWKMRRPSGRRLQSIGSELFLTSETWRLDYSLHKNWTKTCETLIWRNKKSTWERWNLLHLSFDHIQVVSRLLNSVYYVDWVFGCWIIHQRFPIALHGKTFQNFVPEWKALSGFNWIQCIAYPLVSIPRAE